MSTAVLPRTRWGAQAGTSTALVVHGLGASAATMWRISETLAGAGYAVTAVDLRGHGRAPRTSGYALEEIAADLVATRPHEDAASSWDLVVGHSIGAVTSTIAASSDRAWAQRLILLDPLYAADEQLKDRIVASQRAAHLSATVESVAETNPHWHELDVELTVEAVRRASGYALEHAVADTKVWDFFDRIAAATVPTLVIGGDPARGALFTSEGAQRVRESNALWDCTHVADAGHNIHRDSPDALMAVVLEWCDR